MLVRNGEDFRIPPDRETGMPQHTLIPVHREMFLQICRDYSSLPTPERLTLTQIRFFYEGLRHELRAMTKPRKK